MENGERNLQIENDYKPYLASVAVTGVTVVVLATQGRIWWCKHADYSPWVSDAWSTHTSQHLFDPYVFTHILHGFLFYWLTSLIFPKMSFGWRFFIAILIESVWEVVENSAFIIEKYRENTASLDYFGDSILNSVGDIVACAFGFWVAGKLKFWRTLAVFLIVEIALLLTIRDSLILNIILLIYPIDAIKNWQTGN